MPMCANRLPESSTRRRQRNRSIGYVSSTIGLISLLMGLLMTLPSVWAVWWLSRPGVLIAEQPWLPIGGGLAAIVFGRRRGLWRIGAWAGLLGVLMAIRPLWHLPRVNQQHEAAMGDGLAADYLSNTNLSPQAIRTRVGLRAQVINRSKAPAIIETRDVAFHATHDSRQTLFLDVYQPATVLQSPRPVIITIHGGGWNGGNKAGFFVAHNRHWARQGYVVFDIQYRLSPDVIWPAHLMDVKTAIRWVRANASRYNVDSDRVALIGRSAGGHLALMAAFTAGDPEFIASDNPMERDDVQAVIAVYAPTDLPRLQQTVVDPFNYWLGASLKEAPELYERASPLYRAHRGAPLVLLAHGGQDNLVVPDQSLRLQQRLRDLGVPCAYLYYPWSRHGLDVSLKGLGGHMLQYDSDRFLAWALHKPDFETISPKTPLNSKATPSAHDDL